MTTLIQEITVTRSEYAAPMAPRTEFGWVRSEATRLALLSAARAELQLLSGPRARELCALLYVPNVSASVALEACKRRVADLSTFRA